MGRVVSVASGKGGVGKSTICCHLGRALAEQGKTTVILEMDSGLRGMDIMLGVLDSIYDFSDFINNRCTLRDATLEVPNYPNLFLVSAPINFKEILTLQQISAICEALKSRYDYVLVDTPAGYNLIEYLPVISDLICIVVTPDPVCVRDAAIFSDALGQAAPLRLIINRVAKDTIKHKMVTDLDEVINETGVQLLGVLPESSEIWHQTSKGSPLKSNSISNRIFKAISNRIQGKSIPLMI